MRPIIRIALLSCLLLWSHVSQDTLGQITTGEEIRDIWTCLGR